MMAEPMSNLDASTVDSFGAEWTLFDQSGLKSEEAQRIFEQYFSEFPWRSLPANARGFDLGCGSGRWARLVAPRVGELHCIDASAPALEVAKRNLSELRNVKFATASVDAIPLDDDSMDFGYSLGVLHHVPDTQAALSCCVKKLKRGAPFLVYLYYALDNRPFYFRAAWRASDVVRRWLSRQTPERRQAVSRGIATAVYWPLARASQQLNRIGLDVERIPLSAYRDLSFYTMCTDAYDRFATPLEQRFTREEIAAMMSAAGLKDVRFREGVPYWCAVGIRD
jgi:ubiquinone/menaquinone biosynthesis C-methylase UbiE